ncbi:hypothetical protein D9M68_464920 [compost metagenome]
MLLCSLYFEAIGILVVSKVAVKSEGISSKSAKSASPPQLKIKLSLRSNSAIFLAMICDGEMSG